MNCSVRKTQSGAQSVSDDQSHGHREDSGQSEIESMLDQINSAQHKHRVDEHEQISAQHFDAVEENCVRGDVVEAKNRYILHTLAKTHKSD